MLLLIQLNRKVLERQFSYYANRSDSTIEANEVKHYAANEVFNTRVGILYLIKYGINYLITA